jgi:monooxygenase
MLSNVPNLFIASGYTNASWTLKVELMCSYAVDAMRLMRSKNFDLMCPRLPGDPRLAGGNSDDKESNSTKTLERWGELENCLRERFEEHTAEFIPLTSSYIMRSKHLFPKQGKKYPWR